MEGHPKISDRVTDLEKYVSDGNDIIHLKLVRKVEDLYDHAGEFKPAMCHQIFNEHESVFGYENLSIKLYFTSGSLKTHLGISFTSKVSPTICDGVEADNILEKLEAILAPGYTTNVDSFSACIPTEMESFRPVGELIYSFTKLVRNEKHLPKPRLSVDEEEMIFDEISPRKNGRPGAVHSSEEKTFVIYLCDTSDPKFVSYLRRMEQFLLWFVDAASFIDAHDEKWKFFVMYEKYKTSDGNVAYAFVGYSSVYNFFSYPSNIRPRVGQMLILPPFQRQGLGVEMLSTIYSHYRNDPKVTEITVEDPSDDFEALRDFVDARDCLKLASYSPENLRKGYSTEMADEAARILKMTKRQSRRIYEVLNLKRINVNDEKEFKAYRLDVKSRLNIPYQKQEKDIKRMMSRKCNSSELQQAAQIDDASRKTELQSNFQNLLQHYQNVLQRLDKYVV